MFNKLQERLGEKVVQTLDVAIDKTAAAVGTAVDAGSRVKALTEDPDQSITVEAMVLVFIDRRDTSKIAKQSPTLWQPAGPPPRLKLGACLFAIWSKRR